MCIDVDSLKEDGFSCYLKGRSYDLQENFKEQDIEKAAYYYKKGYYEYGNVFCKYSIAASLNDENFLPFLDDEDKKIGFPKYEEIEELSKRDDFVGTCATFVCAFYQNYGIQVSKNEDLAFNLIMKCANKNHTGAFYDLGTVSKFIERIGEEKSIEYLKLASKSGSLRAKKKLEEKGIRLEQSSVNKKM